MIRQLRRKFILISMCSVAAVLLILMAGINIVNAVRVDDNADELLSLLTEHQGSFPPTTIVPHRGQRPFSAETPFETRYFSVVLNSSGQAVRINTASIAAVTEEAAVRYAQVAAARNRDEGYMGVYKYKRVAASNGTLYLFLDRERELSTLRSFFLSSLYISLGGLAAVFLLIVLLSRRVIRPIAESYEKQKRFITDASHELKTPLTIIDANTEVLELEHGENEWTASIKNQVGRLASLTDSLTALCRMEETGNTQHTVDFSLSDAVREALEPFEAPATQCGKKLCVDVEDGITLHGDERAIRQLVSLLADNAVKYAAEGGCIRFSLKQQGKHPVLQCYNPVDTIEPGNQEHLFERFYRGDPSRSSEVSGSGIGLSIAKAIVTSMNGHITAHSADGHSLCITAVF